eukprot:scaffold119619_cov61-Phaeocystis_antarctica.AAC.5
MVTALTACGYRSYTSAPARSAEPACAAWRQAVRRAWRRAAWYCWRRCCCLGGARSTRAGRGRRRRRRHRRRHRCWRAAAAPWAHTASSRRRLPGEQRLRAEGSGWRQRAVDRGVSSGREVDAALAQEARVVEAGVDASAVIRKAAVAAARAARIVGQHAHVDAGRVGAAVVEAQRASRLAVAVAQLRRCPGGVDEWLAREARARAVERLRVAEARAADRAREGDVQLHGHVSAVARTGDGDVHACRVRASSRRVRRRRSRTGGRKTGHQPRLKPFALLF